MSKIYINYSQRLKDKITYGLSVEDLNAVISLFNYSFATKNNFFVDGFNMNQFKNVYTIYNTLKTNILTDSGSCGVMHNLEVWQLKLMRHILINFIDGYDTFTQDDAELCLNIAKENIQNVATVLTQRINGII